MDEILKFNTFNHLKKVYRFNSVEGRKESSAEHTWSCLMLADYFLSITNLDVDRLKIYELLMYHDVVEIETGDIPIDPKGSTDQKKEGELEAAKRLKDKLPKKQFEKFIELFTEFENYNTIEARFAVAVDKFDGILQEIDYKEDWKNWSKQFLLDLKSKYFEEFPEIKKIFLETVDWLEENDYFGK